jgi:hypothetical protein
MNPRHVPGDVLLGLGHILERVYGRDVWSISTKGVLSRYKKGDLTADWDPEMARSNYRVVQLRGQESWPPPGLV